MIVLALLAIPVAFILGAVMGTCQVYNNFSTAQQVRIERCLREDPRAFGNLAVHHASNGWAFPAGTVATQADHDRLARRLRRMFGDELSEDMMVTVEVQAD